MRVYVVDMPEIYPIDPFGVVASWDLPTEALRQAVLDHGLVLLRGRVLSPGQQVQLTRRFGTALHRAGPHLRWIDEHPEIFVFSNDPARGSTNNGQYWHCDGHYLKRPAAISIHHVPECPAGSITSYADLFQALMGYEEFEHEFLGTLFTQSQTRVCHPLVVECPATKRRSLYVNFDPHCRIKARPAIVMPAIEEDIKGRLDRIAYHHEWRPGDTIITNALQVAHKAHPCLGGLRLLHRTTIPIDGVWWYEPAQAA